MLQTLHHRPEIFELKAHVVHDSAAGAGGGLLLSEEHEHVRKLDDVQGAELDGLAAERFPKCDVLVDVFDQEVVVTHGDGVRLGGDELRGRRRGRHHHD